MPQLIQNIKNVQQYDQPTTSRERFLKRLTAAAENVEQDQEDHLPTIEFEATEEVATKKVRFF